MIQKRREMRYWTLLYEEQERHKNSLGGVWSFGSGSSGQLGHGDRKHKNGATQIACLRGLGVCQVYAVRHAQLVVFHFIQSYYRDVNLKFPLRSPRQVMFLHGAIDEDH